MESSGDSTSVICVELPLLLSIIGRVYLIKFQQ